ncbi:STAS domain-containing protein [Streptomyces sp. NPDC007851]|uniref:STAS domain-containing protein n=1 Tax=Streptomyces sp. NPDC007851 TaxID=3155008 RepID=UPI0034007C04
MDVWTWPASDRPTLPIMVAGKWQTAPAVARQDWADGTVHYSTGINIFVAAHRTLTEAGGWIRLGAPTEAVMRTLQIVGVDAVIDCRETLRQALSD